MIDFGLNNDKEAHKWTADERKKRRLWPGRCIEEVLLALAVAVLLRAVRDVVVIAHVSLQLRFPVGT